MFANKSLQPLMIIWQVVLESKEQTKCGVPYTFCDWMHLDPQKMFSGVTMKEVTKLTLYVMEDNRL